MQAKADQGSWFKRLLLGGWLVLLGSGVYQLQWSIEISRAQRGRSEPLYLPNGKLLNIVSLGYENVLADVLWLYSIQYAIEEFWGERKYVWLYHIYDLITDLDPQFEAAYLQGSIFLGMMQGRSDLALQLLEKGKRANPKAWVYPAEQSFYAALQLRDLDRAIAYLDEAARLPGAPPELLARMAGYYRTTGQEELALQQWQQMEATASDPKFRKVAQENMAHLLEQLASHSPQAALHHWRRLEQTVKDPKFAKLARKKIQALGGGP